jgi:hypothetical protein
MPLDEASLVYRVSSRTARAIQRNPPPQKKKKEGWVMAQFVRGLPFKHEDPSLGSKHLSKNWAWVYSYVIQVLQT